MRQLYLNKNVAVWRQKGLWVLVVLTLLTMAHTVPPEPGLHELGACEYWISPFGDNDNVGTADAPWATVEHAAEHIPDANCTIWLGHGVYEGSNKITRRFNTSTTFKAIHPYQAVLENNGPVLKLDGVRNIIFEGLELRHAGSDVSKYVVVTSRRDEQWSEYVTFRNNIFRNSLNDDLLKIHDGSRFFTIENNIFYNQAASEQHMDVNSVTDIVIQDNIFFNDFEDGGNEDTKHFIIIKDSDVSNDGLQGSERIYVRRNIFLNWQGGVETFVKVGNDGQPFYEAKDVVIENNLMIGNSQQVISTAFGVRGARDILFANNTIVGDLPSKAYAFALNIAGENPPNENIRFVNNIWSDPTGTMGEDFSGGSGKFSSGEAGESNNLVLYNNLYWNGGSEIPEGSLLSPLVDDSRPLVADPLINENHSAIILPRWQGVAFLSGNRFIRDEFVRLASQYGRIANNSPAIGQADPNLAPNEDILGHPRSATPDLGAYEYKINLSGSNDLTSVKLDWSPLHEGAAATVSITYRFNAISRTIFDIPATLDSYIVDGLIPYTLYSFMLTVRDDNGNVLAQSDEFVQLTSDKHSFICMIFKK